MKDLRQAYDDYLSAQDGDWQSVLDKFNELAARRLTVESSDLKFSECSFYADTRWPAIFRLTGIADDALWCDVLVDEKGRIVDCQGRGVPLDTMKTIANDNPTSLTIAGKDLTTWSAKVTVNTGD